MTTEQAYHLGYDCGKNGSNTTNSHFSIFSNPEFTKWWENGKRDADAGLRSKFPSPPQSQHTESPASTDTGQQEELNWIITLDRLPEKEGYYKVKFLDGTEDEKPFRIRPSKNILGFMTEKTVVAWKEIVEPLTGKELSVWNTCIDAAITKAKLASTVIDKTKVFEFVTKLETLKLG